MGGGELNVRSILIGPSKGLQTKRSLPFSNALLVFHAVLSLQGSLGKLMRFSCVVLAKNMHYPLRTFFSSWQV